MIMFIKFLVYHINSIDGTKGSSLQMESNLIYKFK